MTTWAEVREVVLDAVAAASGLPAAAITWHPAGQPLADPLVRLSISSVRDISEPREILEEQGSGLQRTLSILREFTVQIRVESINAAFTPDALSVACNIGLGLRLQIANVAPLVLIRTHPQYDLTFRHGEHLVYARAFDAEFRGEFAVVDSAAVGIVEHVVVSGETTNPVIDIPEQTLPPLM